MKKIIKVLLIVLVLCVGLFATYAYKLHALAVEGNKIFEYRCTNVNPPLIAYKNAFLLVADMLNNPENYEAGSGETAFGDYVLGMRAYLKEENKWLEMQSEYMNSWDFQLLEPWYMKQAAEYQWKMYEGYRDDAKYMLATFDAGGWTEEIGEKFNEARDRRNKYENLYYEFFDEASEISDIRKIFGNVPVPEGCNEDNMTIPNTSGAIDWEGEEEPEPLPEPIDFGAAT